MQANILAGKSAGFMDFLMLAKLHLPDNQQKDITDLCVRVQEGKLDFKGYLAGLLRSVGQKKLGGLLRDFEEYEKRRAIVEGRAVLPKVAEHPAIPAPAVAVAATREKAAKVVFPVKGPHRVEFVVTNMPDQIIVDIKAVPQ